MILRHPLVPVRRLLPPRPDATPVGLAAERVAAFLLHRNAFRPEEPTGPTTAEQEAEPGDGSGCWRQDHH